MPVHKTKKDIFLSAVHNTMYYFASKYTIQPKVCGHLDFIHILYISICKSVATKWKQISVQNVNDNKDIMVCQGFGMN